MSGLSSNSLLSGSTTHLLTGYIGSVSFLNAVIDTYNQAKEASGGKLKYVCDPVMGDEGKMYVSEELLGVYKSQGEKRGRGRGRGFGGRGEGRGGNRERNRERDRDRMYHNRTLSLTRKFHHSTQS